MRISIEVPDPQLILGYVVAEGVEACPSPPELVNRIAAAVARAAQSPPNEPDPGREAVRALLRRGGFKPSGRGKPASEYLAQAAREGRFPSINRLVDIINLVSLESGFPISLLDLAVTGTELTIRYGRPGESYVFNRAGQAIDLAGLLCACRVEAGGSRPLGNPVKDSLEAKVTEGTRAVVGLLYATAESPAAARVSEQLEHFAALLRGPGGARSVRLGVLRSERREPRP